MGELLALHSPFNHLLEGISVRKPCPANADVFLQTEIFDLMKNSLDTIFSRAAVLVGFDSSNI